MPSTPTPSPKQLYILSSVWDTYQKHPIWGIRMQSDWSVVSGCKGNPTICVRERIWLAVSAASSSEDSSVSSWLVRFRLGVLLEHWYSCRDGVSPLSMLSRERRRTPQLKLSILSPWQSKTWCLKYQKHASRNLVTSDIKRKHRPRWKILKVASKAEFQSALQFLKSLRHH